MTLFALLCLWPHLGRLRYPSLYGDDVVRIASERVSGTPRLLFRPFNEHMAPLFQALTGVCWRLSFDRLTRAAIVLTWASYLPFLIILPVLFRILREETASLTAALVATAAFSISWLHVETIDWYSASSFMWALLGTLVAWDGAREPRKVSTIARPSERLVAAIAAGLAPATSAIGLIAGPLAGLRGLAGRERRRSKNIAAPWIGTTVYIVICLFHHYGNHVVANVAQKGNFRLGSLAIGLAPLNVLIPALFGLGNLHGRVADAIAVATTLGLTALAIYWAARSRFRAIILGGLALILGGYVMTYLVRTSFLRVEGVLDIQRYHLFPQLGLCFIVAALLGSLALVKRLDDRPTFAWAGAIAAALLLNMAHDQTIRSRSNFYRYPDQMKALAALDRVAAICRANRIPRAQALRAFDPVLTKWFPYEGFNQLEMLPPTLDKTVLTDDEARSLILQSLDPDEREGFLGGMDASKYIRSFANLGPTETVATGKRRSSSASEKSVPAAMSRKVGRPMWNTT